MSIKDMNHVTVEQVLSLRDEAINIERQRDQLAEVLRVAMKSLSTYGNHPIIEDRARDALKAMEE